MAFTFTVTASGPFGEIHTRTYVIDLSEIRRTSDRPAGSLYELTRAVKDLTKELATQLDGGPVSCMRLSASLPDGDPLTQHPRP